MNLAPPMAKFKVSKTHLRDFIVPLRRHLAKISGDMKNHIEFVMLPVLKDIEKDDTYFYIFLIAAQFSIVRVLIRKVDLYVVVSRVESDGKSWIVSREKDGAHKATLEFLDQNIYKVPNDDGTGFLNPVIAPFNADYPNMEGHLKGREDIKLGRDELIQAVHIFLREMQKDVPALAAAFIVMAETIAEALHFHTICDSINDRFYEKVGTTPVKNIVYQQSEWGNFSKHLIRYAHEKERKPFVLVGGKKMSIDDAKAIVALIKGFKIEELCADDSHGESSGVKYKHKN